ncbi:MAG: hypothetical protein KAR22_02000, partial [Gammaproteobacteria bacterium]|nr:hypothetical protein [Gammaproteobacteria bacterium]
ECQALRDAPVGFTVLSAVGALALCMMALEDVGGSMFDCIAILGGWEDLTGKPQETPTQFVAKPAAELLFISPCVPIYVS